LCRDEQRHNCDHIVPALPASGRPGCLVLSVPIGDGLVALGLRLPVANLPAHLLPGVGHRSGRPERGESPACYRPREKPDQGQENFHLLTCLLRAASEAGILGARLPRKDRRPGPCVSLAAMYRGSCHTSRMYGLGWDCLLAVAGGATAGPASRCGSGELTRMAIVDLGLLRRSPGGRREAAAIQRLEHSPVTPPVDHRGHLLRSARSGLSISLNGTNQLRARCSADCTAIRHANFT
jgi:hypothetical protein